MLGYHNNTSSRGLVVAGGPLKQQVTSVVWVNYILILVPSKNLFSILNIMVNVLKFQTLVADTAPTPHWSSLIRVFSVCFYGKHLGSSNPDNPHFLWKQKVESVRNFRTFTMDLGQWYTCVFFWTIKSLLFNFPTLTFYPPVTTSIVCFCHLLM